MAKGKRKGGKKNKSSAKVKAKKEKKAKAKKGKKAKVASQPKGKKTPKAAKTPKEKAPKIKPPVDAAAVVSETPKEEVAGMASAVAAPAAVAPPPAPAKPDHIDVLAKSLDKSIKAYGRPMTKKALEDFLSLMPPSSPYVIPKYEGTSFTVEISDGLKKVVIPVSGSYPLAI